MGLHLSRSDLQDNEIWLLGSRVDCNSVVDHRTLTEVDYLLVYYRCNYVDNCHTTLHRHQVMQVNVDGLQYCTTYASCQFFLC